MENKNTITIILAIGLIVLAVFSIYTLTKTNTQKNTISVSGTSSLDAMPDEAEVYFRIETINLDPKLAQQLNTALSNKVIALLKNNGLNDKDIETLNFNLEKYREWGKDGYIDKGYRASHSFKLTTKDLSKVGEYIDLVIGNDVKNVDSLRFKLSDEKEKQVKSELLSKATLDAKSKAELLAKSLGSKVKGIVSVAESSQGYVPYYYAESAMLTKAAAEPMQVQPKSVSLTVNVNAVFEI